MSKWLMKISVLLFTAFVFTAAYAQQMLRERRRPTPEADARANDYLAHNPALHAELSALFGNWTNAQ